jgi:hypothetical protein
MKVRRPSRGVLAAGATAPDCTPAQARPPIAESGTPRRSTNAIRAIAFAAALATVERDAPAYGASVRVGGG